jgi:hypothetical protein
MNSVDGGREPELHVNALLHCEQPDPQMKSGDHPAKDTLVDAALELRPSA